MTMNNSDGLVGSFRVFEKRLERVSFDDVQVRRIKQLWDSVHVRYINNRFFKSLYDKVVSGGSLSAKQWGELDFLLKNGKSRYEAGELPNNY